MLQSLPLDYPTTKRSTKGEEGNTGKEKAEGRRQKAKVKRQKVGTFCFSFSPRVPGFQLVEEFNF